MSTWNKYPVLISLDIGQYIINLFVFGQFLKNIVKTWNINSLFYIRLNTENYFVDNEKMLEPQSGRPAVVPSAERAVSERVAGPAR